LTTPATPAAPGGPRRRKPPKPVEVVRVEHVSPRLISVFVAGHDLDAYAEAAPTSHVKLFLPAAGQDAPSLPKQGPDGLIFPEGDDRPVVRTYTPRSYDPATRQLEIQFLLHGTGPATEWAQRAKPGDKLGVGGPGGRFSLEPAAGHWWLGADESALPAVGTLLDALPDSATVEVHIEVEGPEDEIDLGAAPKTTVTWHHRRAPDAFGAELLAAAKQASFPDGARLWVACESGAIRGIRRYLTRERGLPLTKLVTRGYWQTGEQNHPDHDYGED
jgi:NADPH-dependent ferric siderophore reductase